MPLTSLNLTGLSSDIIKLVSQINSIFYFSNYLLFLIENLMSQRFLMKNDFLSKHHIDYSKKYFSVVPLSSFRGLLE